MTDDELKKIQKYFRLAWKNTVPALARYQEDAVQGMVETYIRTKRDRITYKKACYMVIDHLRANFVGRRAPGTSDALHARQGALVFAKPMGDNEKQYLVGHTDALLLDSTVHLEELLPHIDAGERPMFLLYYKWGFNLVEIGECFDRSDTWVYLKLKAVHRRIRAIMEKTR